VDTGFPKDHPHSEAIAIQSDSIALLDDRMRLNNWSIAASYDTADIETDSC
jgi:hypothetical protein